MNTERKNKKQHETIESLDFEAHIERVKNIIQSLNNNEINLKDGLQLYREAQKHLGVANQMLEDAEFELKNALEQK
ncbi:exodeoxyribonuclease VII small subunit [Helicobacter didelphidarum]|uniref:Exodeoxyribonuclease VII small subunit n=1 Tax=Helicobacter didelphidarum TaxID=2040648 RepID=A0A3D8IRQ2_9HELI|nr:exodeoxyribonuclease VII small subunit [Helicobacter didelphidarum]RDU67660.1 exodeoxyribonuclease VII small subunit [Helicobacter didelphidarum]